MKKLLAFITLAVTAFAQTPVNVQKGGSAGTNNITGDLNIATGRTVTVKTGGEITVESGGALTLDSGASFALPTDSVTWASVNKTGSSLADLTTRSASDLSSGTLPDGRFPATLPAVSGVNLTALNATQLTSGSVPLGRLYTSAVGYGIVGGSNLDEIASLSTQAFGRNRLTDINADAAITALGAAKADMTNAASPTQTTKGVNYFGEEEQLIAPLFNSIRAASAKSAAMTKAGITVLCVGDSNTAGFGANGSSWDGCAAKSYPAYLAQQLTRAGIPAKISGFVGTQLDTPTPSTVALYDPRRQFIGGSTISVIHGLGGRYYQLDASGEGLGYSLDPTDDRATIIYARSPGNGTFTVNVDGGATLATVNSNGVAGVLETTVTFSAGATQLRVMHSTGSGEYILGIITGSTISPRVNIVNAGLGGVTTATVAASGAFAGGAGLQAITADATIVSLGINDIGGGVTAISYQSSLNTIIGYRAAKGDTLIVSPSPFSNVNYSTLYPQYILAMKSVASTNSSLFVNMATRQTSYSVLNSLGLRNDTIHPNAAGYADFAQGILTLFIPVMRF